MKTVYACEQVRKRFTLLGHMKAWENSSICLKCRFRFKPLYCFREAPASGSHAVLSTPAPKFPRMETPSFKGNRAKKSYIFVLNRDFFLRGPFKGISLTSPGSGVPFKIPGKAVLFFSFSRGPLTPFFNDLLRLRFSLFSFLEQWCLQ